VIAEVRPDFIIEAGTFRGGSALYFAHVLEGLGLQRAKVITIDIHKTISEASALPLWRKHVRFIHGSSTDPKLVARLAEHVRGKKVMVVLDSDHSKAHVLAELTAYAPMVSPDSYIIAEDTSLDAIPLVLGMGGSGPMAAVEEFLESEAGAAFLPDAAREVLVVTFHPGGWLRRVR
jgi:cephalosporin hydroxylase